MPNARELAPTAHCLCLASRRAARTITRLFDRELRAYGIRATQFSLLASLELKGPQSIGHLAEFLSLDRTTLTRNLALVEKLSLITIEAGADARSRLAAITPAGRRALTKAFSAWQKVQSRVTAAIGEQAADGLRRLAARSVAAGGP